MDAAVGIVLSPALQVLFDRLASPVLQMLADILGFNYGVFQDLQRALVRAQATVEHAEVQQFTNKTVRLWLSDLKNAVCDAEDLLDLFTAKQTIRTGGDLLDVFTGGDLLDVFTGGDLLDVVTAEQTDRTGERFGKQMLESCTVLTEKVRKTLHKLETIVADGSSKLNMREPPQLIPDQLLDKWETSSLLDSRICGREDDKERLVKLLLSSQTNYQDGYSYATCIPIIGIGGIGKTTLAQLAYHDKVVIQHFDARMWTYVSSNFNVKKIMKTIIASLTSDECKLSEIELLQSQLWQLLHNKRYLIVLDNVWTEDQDDWDKLRPLFRGGVDGCKVIVTTRSKKIPFMMDFPNSPIDLNGLTDDDCWSLFKQRAFGRGEEEKYPKLSLIGKQIVKKCGGVPLAAKSLGSSMRLKREEKQWLSMRDCELWKLDENQHKVLPALMLSYHHLPSHLRECFAFCSIFPKNYEFQKQKLIHLWMASGLILQEGSRRAEDIGDEYFAELLWLSFFQEVELCGGGVIIGYKMNDVIHELALYVAGNESQMLEHDATQIRHASVVYKYKAIGMPKDLFEAKHLRTLLLIGESGLLNNKSKMFSSFAYLRVLDLSSCGVSDLPESLGDMICLRYLDLSYTPITKLPHRTKNLCSLQTLNLFGCHNLRWLPSLARMTGLRHLNLTGCVSLLFMPPEIGRLLRLQTLPLFVVNKTRGALNTLKYLNLYGKLNITHLENARYAAEAQSAGLKLKENLGSLGLYWGSYCGDESFRKRTAETEIVSIESPVAQEQHEPVEEILEGLQPHQNLKRLVINGYPGNRFPHWALPNLIAVNFTNCKNCEHLPALGNLMLLKTLSLHGIHGVKSIGTEFYGDSSDVWFPSLEELSISDFANLEEWSSANDGTAFPRLKKLTVKSCPKLAHIPLSQSLQNLELRDCNPTMTSIANLSLLSVLVLEKIPDLFSLPQGLFTSACLSSLTILSCPKLRSLPLEIGNLTALKSLTIRWCDELSSLPESLQNLKALESLEISDCHSLISLPDGGIAGLCSLQTLSIENCSHLTYLSSSLEHLTFLEHLTIMYCPNLGSFPEGVQHLSSLRSLSILNCPWFDALPIGLQNLQTLHCLEISSCPKLDGLPDWLENLASLRSLTISDCPNSRLLPPGLKFLTELQHLSIQECPELEERCRQGSGEDWLKIAHVPHRYIGSPQIRQSDEASTSGSSSSGTSFY